MKIFRDSKTLQIILSIHDGLYFNHFFHSYIQKSTWYSNDILYKIYFSHNIFHSCISSQHFVWGCFLSKHLVLLKPSHKHSFNYVISHFSGIINNTNIDTDMFCTQKQGGISLLSYKSSFCISCSVYVSESVTEYFLRSDDGLPILY